MEKQAIIMSRHTRAINTQIRSWYGNDHAIGKFIDLTSEVYAETDEIGEGYFFEWSEMFGITNNLAKLTLEEVKGETPSFFEKIKTFHESLK